MIILRQKNNSIIDDLGKKATNLKNEAIDKIIKAPSKLNRLGLRAIYFKNKELEKAKEIPHIMSMAIKNDFYRNDNDKRMNMSEYQHNIDELKSEAKKNDYLTKIKSGRELQKIKNKARDFILDRVADVTTKTPGTNMGTIVRHALNHPAMYAAPFIPIPGLTEYMVGGGEKELRKRVPLYEKISKGTGWIGNILSIPVQHYLDRLRGYS